MTRAGTATCFAAVAGALVLTGVAAGADGTAAPWRQWTVASPAVSIALPATWIQYTANGRRAVFEAYAPASRFVGVVISLTPRRGDSFRQMVRDWLTSLRVARLTYDPKARVTAKRVHLPVGQAEVATTVTIGDKATRTPVVLREYALLHKGRGYVFSFESDKRRSSHYAAIFAHAADSVRFTR